MSNYIGVRCPVCHKKFSEADDIVVCPICGAPHHRDCYTETNQCFFVADHLSGKEWSDPAGQVSPEEEKAQKPKVCSRCGADNPTDSIFCQVCGYPITIKHDDAKQQQQQQGNEPPQYRQEWVFPGGMGMQIDTISMAYGGLDPDEEIDGETVRDIATFVGNGSAYYLPRFRIFGQTKRSFMPSISAFFFNFFYYFYRKMYVYGAILLVLYVVGSIPNFLYMWEYTLPRMINSMTGVPDVALLPIDQAVADHYLWLSNVTRSINICISLIFSMFANRLYYTKALSSVQTIRGSYKDQPQETYAQALSKAGGTNKVLVIVLAAVLIGVGSITVWNMMYRLLGV